MKVMSGELSILVVLCCSVAAYVADNLPPPTDIQIHALGLGRVEVSWNSSAIPPGKEIVYSVRLKTPDMEEELMEFPHDNFFMTDWLAVHRGLTVHVAVIEQTDDGILLDSAKWASEVLPPFPGDEGTEPLKLTCNIHIQEFEQCWLHCDWLPGERAPLDTQYYLYFRHIQDIKPCLNYVIEPGGQRRTGCRTLFSYTLLKMPKFLVHINGSSHSRQIRAIEHVYTIHDIEIISPVWNLTLKDNCLSWKKPIGSLPNNCFNYQIQIWSKDKNETITVSQVHWFLSKDLKEPITKHHMRVRAVGKSPCWHIEKYSSWTEVIHIGKNEDMLWVTLTGCLCVACLVLFLLCARFWRSVFPQIPKPKDDLKDAFRNTHHQALMRCTSWDTEEVISYIEVMGYPDKPSRMPLDYVQVAY
ncbi:interleukin-5 receptor subunit alpha isoform X2 [Pyxicephalus adspersus]|uniref:interleukin-5 receptor subunit alpha isoform X2 n=1 Tax=Pyxicephalus adspersus TaxID=30357 RepID=UPI003B5B93B3